ncbi:hypothetical protein [Streptomyces sp. TP-A0356]|uniref:hypothetical protein n=1 Tax=Streptomyces sp. TP-A0356 TaxID=1359208 RepID=UPI000ADE913B|nr:hypothetical protein [Streptomyces sp. TP-A0356]
MDELTALAAAGATALVTQMVTDGWAQVRDRVAAFFAGRRGGDGEVVQGELERSRAELVAARDAGDEETASDIQDEWRSRLRRTLRNDPQAVSELRSLLDELAPNANTGSGGTVNNTISGGVQHGTVVQARTVGDLSIGDSRR